MIVSATLYSAIVWPSSRLRGSTAAAVYAWAKAKSFKKGSTSLRASRKVVPRFPGERGAATACLLGTCGVAAPPCFTVLGLMIGADAAATIPRGSDRPKTGLVGYDRAAGMSNVL